MPVPLPSPTTAASVNLDVLQMLNEKAEALNLSPALPSPVDAESDSESSASTYTLESAGKVERRMGDSELSYYLPSRASGVNDMYLQLGFTAPEHLMARERVLAVWTLLRTKHPLLAAHVEMHGYDDVRFVASFAQSVEDALSEAACSLEYRSQSKDQLIDSYLNGPRTLSNDRLSYLIVSERAEHRIAIPSPPPTPNLSDPTGQPSAKEYDILICAAHFIGDGMALHAFANDFFGLLGGDKATEKLQQMIHDEWSERAKSIDADEGIELPNALESNFKPRRGKFYRAADRVDFENSEAKFIGGHSLPRTTVKAERHTIVPTVSFDEQRTKAILKACKAHGVSISTALFAICNLAWIKTCGGAKKELPMMMYSALNLRPYFDMPMAKSSYWYLAVGYFNVVLPTFLPSSCSESAAFWLRAQSAKKQSARAAKSPMIPSRSLEMSRLRGRRARAWAKEDDERENGTWVPPTPKIEAPPTTQETAGVKLKPPAAALLGLSLLGNLDGIYKHATFPEVKMHTLTTGSRQRQGGMLMFGYTFAGKLWVSLGYDENAFEKKTVQQFWANVLEGVQVFL